MEKICRCKFCNLKNPIYVDYHDKEWGVLNLDEKYLFEMFILELFQAGLSWECVLNKREAFREAFENFDMEKIIGFDEKKIQELMANPKIIRNRLKIKAAVSNAGIYKSIQQEFGGFAAYLRKFCGNEIIYENDKTENALSLALAKDLKKRGMKFCGSITIYSYLQAVGLINSHEKGCFKYETF